MDFLRTDIKKLYFKFLFPSMMSALVTSVYFFVDAIAVGQSEGALGAAAMAVTSPTYGVMAFLAVLCGVGGSVMIGMMLNNQIARRGGTIELAVFGVMSTLMSLFFAMFAGVGQAVQPIVSTNYGAGQVERIKVIWKLSFATVLIMGAMFTAIGELFPIPVTRFFMNATPEVLTVAPRIFRLFFPMFMFLGVTVLADYYMQSVMEVKMSMVIGLSHSVLISGLMIFALPAVLAMDGVWLAMPVAELIVSLIGAWYIISRANRKMV